MISANLFRSLDDESGGAVFSDRNGPKDCPFLFTALPSSCHEIRQMFQPMRRFQTLRDFPSLPFPGKDENHFTERRIRHPFLTTEFKPVTSSFKPSEWGFGMQPRTREHIRKMIEAVNNNPALKAIIEEDPRAEANPLLRNHLQDFVFLVGFDFLKVDLKTARMLEERKYDLIKIRRRVEEYLGNTPPRMKSSNWRFSSVFP